MVNIYTASKAAIKAYAAVISLGRDLSQHPLSEIATGMANLYLPNATLFTLGSIATFPDTQFATSNIENILLQYNRSGLGTDIRLESSHVDVISDQSSLCWITWKIFPPRDPAGRARYGQVGNGNGKGGKLPKPWTFTDVYGFRLVPNGTVAGLDGGWELVNADDEFEKLAEKWPVFFSS